MSQEPLPPMIRTVSIMLQLGPKNQVMVMIGWLDRAQLKTREKMATDAHNMFTRFQQRTRLKPEIKFSLEDLALFAFNDTVTKPDLVRVNDVSNGAGVELQRPAKSSLVG